MHNESVAKTLLIGVGICVVCSVLVSAANVGLRPLEERNRQLDRNRNILLAAGLLQEGQAADVEGLFAQIDARVVDLDTGEFVDDASPDDFDAEASPSNPATSRALDAAEDVAGIKRRPNRQVVYFVGTSKNPSRVILPVYGKGLWSTMNGLVALDRDLTTVKSLAFFAHGETPGLGGEVDNPRWKAKWIGKQAFDAEGRPCLEVIKGQVNPSSPDASRQVDGLSGATLTARGVNNLLKFWLGEQGYGPFLEKLHARLN